MPKQQQVSINNFPSISSYHKRKVLVGIRPFRKGGLRIQKQILKDKTVVHNYGHGGAGVSLAPSTARESADLVESVLAKGEEVVVLGCGIVGLMTAIQCANRGMKIRILADRIATQKQQQATLMCTSEVAPGYWLPYHYEFTDVEQHQKRTNISYQLYQQWISKVTSIRPIDVYESETVQSLKKKAPVYIYQKARMVTLKIGNKQFNSVTFQTLQINLQHFLQELIHIARTKGIQFENKALTSLNDVCQLKQKVIVNCLGYGSKKVFGDQNMYGVKGHLIEYSNPTKIKGIYGFVFEGQPVKFYCFDNKILLGLTKEDSDNTEVNKELVEELEKRAYLFIESLGLNYPNILPRL